LGTVTSSYLTKRTREAKRKKRLVAGP
jgi:hypothetical protein